MRSVLLVVALLALAFAGAFAVQVLMAQSKEEGSFSDRVASVMQRQLGLGVGTQTVDVVDAATESAPMADAAMEEAPMEGEAMTDEPMEAPPPAAMQPRSAYSLAPGAMPSPGAVVRLSDLTISDLEALFRNSTRAELEGLARRLEEVADKRDQDGFWTDVRLNMLFMLLSFALPVAFARMRR